MVLGQREFGKFFPSACFHKDCVCSHVTFSPASATSSGKKMCSGHRDFAVGLPLAIGARCWARVLQVFSSASAIPERRLLAWISHMTGPAETGRLLTKEWIQRGAEALSTVLLAAGPLPPFWDVPAALGLIATSTEVRFAWPHPCPSHSAGS